MNDKIRIDVLTLDSVQCAACGYMMESIAALPKDVQEMIDYTEWSIKTKEGIAMFTRLKGKVLPTICIEEDLVFQSMIPQYEELIDALAVHTFRIEHRCIVSSVNEPYFRSIYRIIFEDMIFYTVRYGDNAFALGHNC